MTSFLTFSVKLQFDFDNFNNTVKYIKKLVNWRQNFQVWCSPTFCHMSLNPKPREIPPNSVTHVKLIETKRFFKYSEIL